MAWSKYTCASCKADYDYVGLRKNRPCPSCGADNAPLLPTSVGAPSVMETVDRGRNVKWRQDMNERAMKRAARHLKHEAVERSRIHGDDKRKHGITEDDPKLQ